jgi:hypothetical protein
VTALSYVMSLMPAQIIADLGLAWYGYRVVAMGPTYVPFADGRSITLTEDPTDNPAELSKFSASFQCSSATHEGGGVTRHCGVRGKSAHPRRSPPGPGRAPAAG